MDFSSALLLLKQGHRVAREGWNGKGMWLGLERPTPGSKMTRPFIYMKDAQGGFVPWLASQTDVLSEDWAVLPDENPSMIGPSENAA